jgi:hypothetical protein
MEKGEVAFPAILDDGSLLNVGEHDYVVLPSGFKAKLDSPCISPDGAWWLAEFTRIR